MIRLEKRPTPSRAWALSTPIIAVILTMIAGGLMFAALGKDPFEVIRVIFWDPLFSERFAAFSRPQLLVKAGPLILIAIGLSLGFRAGIWNIGAEGQYIIGALCGAAFGLSFYPSESPLIFPGMVIAGLLGGTLWAMIPALLKIKANTNEILVSLLLVYVAEAILASAATSWLRNPDGQGFPGSRNLSRHAGTENPIPLEGLDVLGGFFDLAHVGIFAAMAAVIAAYVLFQKHLLGYQIKLAGQAPRAAKFSGVSPALMVVLCLGVSGALAGVAGLFEVSGPAGQITIDFNVGYGFTAIIVAFLGRLHPVGILFAGLLMALTYIGGELAQLLLQVPGPAIQAFQGMLLFFLLALDVLSNYRVRFGRGGAA
ncbi:MAG: ABC transporter permease [Roseicyclus sp.]|nr:ABC transporter permease [Roseicyclus sp.]